MVDPAAPSGREVHTVELPRPGDGFYYTAVLEGATCAPPYVRA